MQRQAVLFGGPYDRQHVNLLRPSTEAIRVNGRRYEAIRDPDTHQPLGGFVYVPTPAQRPCSRPTDQVRTTFILGNEKLAIWLAEFWVQFGKTICWRCSAN